MNETFELKPKDDIEKEVEYYTVLGSQDFLDDDNNPRLKNEDNRVLAKRMCYYNDNDELIVAKTRHQIKVGAYGRIYNPIGLYSEGQSNKFSSKSGKEEWRMREVNEYIFNLYLSFLKTKNVAHLKLAERGLQ